MTDPRARSLSWPATLALVAGAYVVPVMVFRGVGTGAEVFSWFATVGLTASVLLLTPTRRWSSLVPLLVVVALAARLTNEVDPAASLAGGLGHVAAALAATLVLLRRDPRSDRAATLETQGDVARVFLASLAAGLVAALTDGHLMVGGAGLVSAEGAAVLASSAVSVLVIVPLVMTLRVRRSGRGGELLLQSALLTSVALVVFTDVRDLPLPFVLVPLLVWGALRFDARTVAAQLLAVGSGAALASAAGAGAFGSAHLLAAFGLEGAAVLCQLYVAAAAFVTLPLVVAITQRTELLSAVSAEEERFRRHFTESLIGGMFLRAEGGRLVVGEVNDAATHILVSSSDELRGRTLTDVLESDEPDRPLTPEAFRSSSAGWHGATRVTSRPGSRVELAVAALAPGADADSFSAQLLDVTTEHEAHRGLETAQILTAAMLDSAACVIVVVEPDGTILRVNGATTEITGYARAELVGQPVWETSIAPMERGDVEAMFLWPIRSGVPMVRERLGATKAGDPMRLVWSNNVVRDEHGAASYAVLTGIDVTSERASTDLVAHLMQATLATALIGIDTLGRVTVFNAGAVHLLGYAVGEIVGQPFARLLDPVQLLERTGCATVGAALLSLVATLRETRESSPSDWTWISRSGSSITVSMTLSLTDDELTDRVGVLCVGRDVTEQRVSRETLEGALETERRAVERLRALDQAKDEFVSTVSHELRTPVTSILGYTEMLQDGSIVAPDPDQLPLLDTIARNGQRLVVICNDLLLLSGLDAGSVPWGPERLDLAQSLATAEESVRPLLLGRDLTLAVEPAGRGVEVMGDRTQLERVMTNLLSNAVKFTDDGGTVRLRLEVDSSHAVLSVHDSGIGIPADEREAVFEKFFRTAVAQKRAIPGTGLGLSIVAAIVEAHAGSIEVTAAAGQGTVFTVRLPLAPV